MRPPLWVSAPKNTQVLMKNKCFSPVLSLSSEPGHAEMPKLALFSSRTCHQSALPGRVTASFYTTETPPVRHISLLHRPLTTIILSASKRLASVCGDQLTSDPQLPCCNFRMPWLCKMEPHSLEGLCHILFTCHCLEDCLVVNNTSVRRMSKLICDTQSEAALWVL